MITTINFNASKESCDFYKPSSTRKIHLNEFNTYINHKRLTNGNSKLVNILIFDLPAVRTCLNSSTCAATCYAVKAQKQYADTKIMRDTNLWLFNNREELLFTLLTKQIKNAKTNVIRLHSSGDFFNQKYIDFWDKIIRLFPNKKFYAYTKVENILDFSNITKNKNFNLISSFINGQLNYGTHDYVESLHEQYGSFICPASANGDIKCGRECNYCVTQSNVVFPIH